LRGRAVPSAEDVAEVGFDHQAHSVIPGRVRWSVANRLRERMMA
jgi:hypothetical protein